MTNANYIKVLKPPHWHGRVLNAPIVRRQRMEAVKRKLPRKEETHSQVLVKTAEVKNSISK